MTTWNFALDQHRRRPILRATQRAGKGGEHWPNRAKAWTLATFAGLVTALASHTLAAPGDLDPAFGTFGRVSLDPAALISCENHAYSVVQQSDGRIVVAGTTYTPVSRLVVARFEPDGTLDATFGTGGTATGTLTGDRGYAVIQQADGKLVVAGSTSSDVALWRFHPDGTADATFGVGGVVRVDDVRVDLPHNGAVALVQQTDGKLVVAGTTTAGPRSQAMILRLDHDGRLDPTFGSDGAFIAGSATSAAATVARSLVQQPDGKLLVVGYRSRDWRATPLVIRTTADGTFDGSFGDGGFVELSVWPDGDSGANSAVVQDDGSIVVAGFVADDSGWFLLPHGLLFRLDDTGALDPAFGAGGVVINDGSENEFNGVTTQSNGQIVVSGARRDSTSYDAVLLRFDTDGSIDATFGFGGSAIADFGSMEVGSRSIGRAVMRQADGNLVVVGTHFGPAVPALAVARFMTDAGGGWPGLIGLTAVRQRVAANDASVSFTVRRTGGSAGAASVEFEAFERVTRAGSTSILHSGRLDWADGDVSEKTISVDLHQGAADEGILLRLTNPSTGAVLAASTAVVSPVETELDLHGCWVSDGSADAPVREVERRGGSGASDAAFLFLLALLAACVARRARSIGRI